MNDALSITAAARAQPDAIAVIIDDQAYSFAACARAMATLALTRPADRGGVDLVAAATPTTVMTIYAALEAGIPVRLWRDEDAWGRAAAEGGPPHAQTPDPAVWIATSGSTGTPTWIELTRRGAIAAATLHRASLGWQADDRWVVPLSLAQVGGLAVLLRCLVARRPAIVTRDRSAAAIDLAVRRHAATLVSVVPAQLQAWLDLGPPPPTVRAILVGGAACAPSLAQRARAAGWPIRTTYGMTETWGQVVTAPHSQAPPSDDAVGMPLPGVTVRAGTEAAPAAIVVDTPTALAPVHTRDLGFVDGAGWLHVVGRQDDVINTGGVKLHPAVLEARLARDLGLAHVCVVGVPDERWGAQLVAVYVPTAPCDIIASTQAWPAAERIRAAVQVPALPLLATGKVDRSACRRLAIAAQTPGPR